MNPIPTFGGEESPLDYRTIVHKADMALPILEGGYRYSPEEIENQRGVGICTSISVVQNVQKVNKKKYSPDFHYLLQKKFVDGGWWEGSSAFSALKVAFKYGFLPLNEFPYGEMDRTDYPSYIKKLQEIPEAEIDRLLTLCVDKIKGYAQVDVSDPWTLSQAISSSKAGLICRYVIGKEWFTPSWRPEDINPLQPPAQIISGHLVTMAGFDYKNDYIQRIANTWSAFWNVQGSGDVDYSKYRCTEAWMIYFDALPDRTYFKVPMKLKDTGLEVTKLQKFLVDKGHLVMPQGVSYGYYGSLTREAVYKFQISANIPMSWYERTVMRGSHTGSKTLEALNR